MQWDQIRKVYPDQWLVVEALQAHTTSDNKRSLDQFAIIDTCPDGASAMGKYRELHQQYPAREFYFLHTSREVLDIQVRKWLGIRPNYAITPGGYPNQSNYSDR